MKYKYNFMYMYINLKGTNLCAAFRYVDHFGQGPACNKYKYM